MHHAALTDRIIEQSTFRRNVYNMIPHGASRILDFGSGIGGLILRLKRDKACTDLHALEINIEDARRLEPLLDGVWRVDYERGESLPEAYQGYFNHVILHDVVEHFFDPWVTLSRIRNLLAPEGRMVISTPNILYWILQYDILRGKFHYGPGFWHTGHLRWYTPASLAELLVVAGLRIEAFYLDIPDKVSFLKAAQAKEIREVSFPPRELAHLHPDKPPVTVTYPGDIKRFYPAFFAGKLIAVCSRGELPYALERITYNCPLLEEIRKRLDITYDVFAPFDMIPLIGTSH